MKKSENNESISFTKQVNTVLVAVSLALLSAPASAENTDQSEIDRFEQALTLTPNVDNGKDLYKLCVSCHGPEGWGSVNGSYPQIAGQLNTVTIKQLSDIFYKRRGNPIMEAFTSFRVLESSQDIADLAEYINKLPMTDNNGKGNERDVAMGRGIYQDNCKDCHGDNGEGHLEDHIPRLYGQHYNYLMRQFSWIRNGHRHNADKKMVKQIQNFTLSEQSAVMSYVASLKPSAENLAKPNWINHDFPHFDRSWSPAPPKYNSLKE